MRADDGTITVTEMHEEGKALELDQQRAEGLGFPKPEYWAIEHERRWVCREVPRARRDVHFAGSVVGLTGNINAA